MARMMQGQSKVRLPFLTALAVLDAGGLEVRNDGEVLPYFALEAVLGELFAEDRVGFADCFESVAGDRAGAANAETRTRERLAVNHACGKAELSADHTDFVLEEDLDGLNELETGSDVFRKAACVVVRLDAGFALEDVGPDGSLCQELHAVKFSRFVSKYVDELLADDVSLLFGIRDACELVQETVYCVDINKVCVHLIAENLDDLLGLAFAKEAVVDMNGNELSADRLDQKCGYYRGINASGQCQQHLVITDLRAELFDLLLNKCLRESGSCNSYHIIGSSLCH